MEQELRAQIMQWHEDNEHQQIVDALLKIPPADRDYDMIGSIGRAYNNLSLYEQALEQFAGIAEQGNNDPLWYFRVGYAYYHLKRYEEAAGVLSTALELDPGDRHAAWLLDRSRRKWQKQQKADSRRTRDKPHKDPGAIPFEGMDLDRFWEDSPYASEHYVSDPPTEELIASVEEELGYKLPAAYIALMKHQNGGVPRYTSFPTDEPTSWADDHIAITGIMGIGRDKSYSVCGDLGSPFMIEEWGYPDIGVVICDCPSAGHDVVMLDYRHCGKDGEPEVIHVDQEDDYEITFLAPDFETFIRGLVMDEDDSMPEALADEGEPNDLAPFILVEQHDGGKSVILTVGSYLAKLFDSRADEGFEGSGYDWAALAAVFLHERMPELADTIRLDPEADMFCAYSTNGAAVEQFARAFKSACEDEALIHDLFTRAELD
ncbi:Imm51 family immunity protein [Paenibacillus methanolicus]|uniref:Tetratricopeptide repeat protein n=1 Tax=Paenibacillus methanolicus TaxID=582686 RepID=A0A5S5C3T4_9BACL|nr:Imm51 family immunity protein [Paenibacillus methanolicus]TYP73278.1 tetratricopeptide repeat protein [Paenibacillus methanolicus]